MWGVMSSDVAQKAHRDYLESRILSARPAERLQWLYKIALDSIRAAIENLNSGDIAARGKAINKAHEAIDELNFALDHSIGASFTRRLADLYLYIQRQLVKGHCQKSQQALQEALSVLTTLAETWDEVVARTCGDQPSVGSAGVSATEEVQEPVVQPVREAPQPFTAYAGFQQEPVSCRDWNG